MTDIQLMILRRMRVPLIIVIIAYTIAVFGLALMPGVDPEGRPWRLSLFDAFYVMSYTATTIGFGEVPYPYSYAQRLWMTFSIYLTVISWAYALGAIFALTRQPAFRAALERGRFEAGVRRLVDRFFVICGHGQSGQRLSAALDRLGFATVVIEADAERLRPLLVRHHAQPAVGMVGDARAPDLLEAAGIRRDNCQGLLVLTPDDEANQAIAIEARVLAPDLPVLARVKSATAQQTLEDFGGVTLVNPFETFAFNFGLALDQPDSLRLEEWLTGVPGAEPPPRVEVPRGHWVLAGYGRFGAALSERLDQAGLTWKAIDLDPVRCGSHGIVGTGLAAEALRSAGLESACGLVAGTDNDVNNLAIVMAARRLKPKLFVVIRQNQVTNRRLIDSARAQMRFVQSDVMTHECLQLLTTPRLNRFLLRAREQSNAWAAGVCGRIRDVVGDVVPHVWLIECDRARLGLKHALVEQTEPALTVGHLLSDPDDRRIRIPATSLLLLRNGRDQLLPDEGTVLQPGDRLLLAGGAGAEALQSRLLDDDVAIDYVRTGVERPRTWLGRWLQRGTALSGVVATGTQAGERV
jgi:Trk K+ transport system NAD-binding subunit